MTAIASVFVEVRPDTSKFGRTLTSSVSSDARKAGTVAGGDLKTAFIKGAAGASAIVDVDKGAADTAGKQAGQAAGDAFVSAVSGVSAKVDVDKAAAATSGKQAGAAAGDAAGDAAADSNVGGGIADSVTGGGAMSMLKGAGAAAGVAIGVALVAGIAEAMSNEAANDKLAAQLGLGARRSEVLGRTAGSLYSDAYGDSLEGVNDALRGVMQNIPKMASAARPVLEATAAKVLDIAAAFDEDSDAITRAAGQMVRTGMADNAKEAFDIITAGFQNGTDKSDDFLDTLNEYGTQFRKLGLDGETATGILSQGLQAGARDADIVADSIKEFSLRTTGALLQTMQTAEGPVTSLTALGEAFKAAGYDANGSAKDFEAASQIQEDIAAGGEGAKRGLQILTDGLRATKNPLEQTKNAVALFGTQAEDMGGALLAIDPKHATDALGKVGGSAKKMGGTLNDNATANITAFTREAKTMAVNIIGGYVIPALKDFAGFLKEHLGPTVEAFIGWFKEHWPDIANTLFDMIGLFKTITAAGLDMSGYLINAFADFLDAVLFTFGKVIDAADWAFGWIPGIGDDIGNAKDKFHSATDGMVNGLHTVGDGLHATADAVRNIPDPNFSTDAAKRKSRDLASQIFRDLHGIGDEDVFINLSAAAQSTLANLGTNSAGAPYIPLVATGGPIFGAGSGTSDSIPALLSNGEHVITAEEVKKAGGHRVWEGLRRLAKRGSLGKHGDLGFKGGGRVNPVETLSGMGSAVSSVGSKFAGLAGGISAVISSSVNDFLTTLTPIFTGGSGGMGNLGSNGSLSPAQIVRGQGFAQSQSGKPYQWGGIGNPSWDCSGFVGGVLLSALGQSPYQRIGTTATMPWSGFSPGTGTFTVGNDPGSHMAGVIGGLGIESNGYWGVKAGSLETPLGTFADMWAYDKGGILPPGFTMAYNGTGANEYVSKFADGGAVDLDAEQRRIAKTIISVGAAMGMTRRDIKIAIMTAMQESGMRNLHYGMDDSQGVFQQRPSMGWGTPEQVTDPEYAARKFFEALKGVAGHESMGLAAAAQAVQRSADGSLYAQHREFAHDVLGVLAGNGIIDGTGGGPAAAAGADDDTKADRRDARKEARQAAREAKKAQDHALAAIDKAFTRFGFGRKVSEGELKDKLGELAGVLKENLKAAGIKGGAKLLKGVRDYADLALALKDTKWAKQATQAFTQAVRGAWQAFDWSKNASLEVIKSETKELRRNLLATFGRNAPIVKAVQNTSDTLLGVARQHDKVMRQIDNGQANLARLLAAQKTLQKDIAGGFDTTSYGGDAPVTAAGLFLSARAERNDARHFKQVLKKLKAKGLAPSILRALALAGPSAIVQAEALAALSSKKLNQYEDLLQQGHAAEMGLGGVVSSASYNPQIAKQRETLQKNNEHLHRLNQRIEHLDDRIEHAVERALRHVRVELDGKRVDRALADHNHRRRRAGS